VLRLEDFSAFKANWNPKPENIREIAAELNIGLDSVVFVDDNPAERSLVAEQLPEVAVPDVGSDVSSFAEVLERERYFETDKLVQDDLSRSAHYSSNVRRSASQVAFRNYGEFLASIEMMAEIGPFVPVYLERITQLINKTNQFNLTTRRYTSAEVEAISRNSAFVTLYGRLADRFGDNGLVSVLIGRVSGQTVELDIWLMSCRVLKREMEFAMCGNITCPKRIRHERATFAGPWRRARRLRMLEGQPRIPPAGHRGRERESNFMPTPAWQIEVDRWTPDEWSKMLDLFNDANVYQTWSYGQVRWGRKRLSHLVLKRGGEVLGMAQLRIVRPTRFNFGMAYLRWGPLCERRGRPLDSEVFTRIASALDTEYVRKRRLFLRILPAAFVGSPRAAVIQSAFCRFDPEPSSPENTYRTFLLDLAPGLEELRKKLDAKWRNHLSRAEKNNLKVIAGNGSAEFRTFCQIYSQMRKRKTFETTVDVEEFGRIQEDLAEPHRMRVLICEDRGVPVAGLVTSAMGDSAIYLLGATSDDGLKSQGAYLLQWTLIRWLKEKGIRWYDLGGIDPIVNPGVYSFKKGFAGADVSQMNPMVACTSVVSSAVVRAGLAMQRTFRSWSEAAPVPSNR
jgi:FkbH-like protein